jgi:hypothetical protein
MTKTKSSIKISKDKTRKRLTEVEAAKGEKVNLENLLCTQLHHQA